MITIKRNKKKSNEYEVKMTLTLGKIYALKTALKNQQECDYYNTSSTLAGELHTALENEMNSLDIIS